VEPGREVAVTIEAGVGEDDLGRASTLVDRMERRGLVERRPAQGDRRVKALALTAEGERLRARFWRGLADDTVRSPRSVRPGSRSWPRCSTPSTTTPDPVRPGEGDRSGN
jgi:DNA-binding PadR family transcriptional regulator